jgi:hypothetical protein
VTVRIGMTLAALAIGVFAAGCESKSGDAAKEQAEQQSTRQQAIAQIAKVRSGLDAALATYRAGDRGKADEQVGDTYLEHFELVEPPLDRVDHELKERTEDTIRETLRDRMKAGAPTADVARLVRQIDGLLDEATTALQ